MLELVVVEAVSGWRNILRSSSYFRVGLTPSACHMSNHAGVARGCCGPKRVDVIHIKLAWGSLYDKPRLVGWYDRTGAVEFRDVKSASLSAWGCTCYLFVRVFSVIK